MTEKSDAERLFDLANFLADPRAVAAAVKDYDAARAIAEDAEEKAKAKIAELTRVTAEADAAHRARLGELAAAKSVHDKAAQEAADRIRVNTAQAAELQRIREENAAKSADLEAREKILSAREKILSDNQTALANERAELTALREQLDSQRRRAEEFLRA